MKKQLVINSAHAFVRPVKNTTSAKYCATYGVPYYGFYLNTSADKIIKEALSDGYTVLVRHANGNDYIAREYHLVNLTKRQYISLLYNHFTFDEIVIDNVLRIVHIWIDG